MAEPCEVERRARQRVATDLAGLVRLGDQRRFQVRVTDLSRSGCCLLGDLPVRVGEEFTLLAADLTLRSTARWFTGSGDLRRTGVTFEPLGTGMGASLDLVLSQIRLRAGQP
jgi:hypothetical protein